MALINCPECQKEVSTLATTCPNCGAPVSTPSTDNKFENKTKPVKEKKKTSPVTWFVVIIIIVLTFGSLISSFSGYSGSSSSSRRSSSPSMESLKYQAKSHAKDIVRENLKAPSTAKFSTVTILEQKRGHYLLQVDVDAQNSFGAMIRNNFMVILFLENNTWKRNTAVCAVGEILYGEKLATFKVLNSWPTN
jgi:hypothetical protein